MALHRISVLLLLSSLFGMSLEKEGKMATRKEAKGRKRTSRKERQSKSPG